MRRYRRRPHRVSQRSKTITEVVFFVLHIKMWNNLVDSEILAIEE